MSWLTITILSYLLLAVVFLIDKFLLTTSIPSPKVYAFYGGIFGFLVVLVAPFIGFYIPSLNQIALSVFSGACFTFGLVWFFTGLKKYEPSRIVPLVGGIVPIFNFIFILLFSKGEVFFEGSKILALLLLTIGTFLICLERKKGFSFDSFKISIFTAFFFSVYMVSMKYVYLGQDFWNGLIWIRTGAFLSAISLLFSKELRTGLRVGKNPLPQNLPLYLSGQFLGATSSIMQNFAVSLAPLAFVPFISALQGTQYVFLLFLTIILSLKFSNILKEEISRSIIFQKFIAILLIAGGLLLFSI